MDKLFENAAFMRYALNAVPSLILVTDEEVRVLFRNTAAAELLKGERIYGDRVGNVMHCLYAAKAEGGCGRGAACADCVLRNAVGEAFSGKAVRRRRTDLSIKAGGKSRAVPALVSASAFTFEGKLHALVVIEDISELVELRSLLPVCSSCSKIRDEHGRWLKVESYIRTHVPEAQLSHGLCPDCAKKLYPGYSD